MPEPTAGLGLTAIALPVADRDDYSVVNDVIAGGPGFVAVGGVGDYGPGHIWLSADGITWELLPGGSEWDGTVVDRVVDWNGVLVAAGSDGDHAAFWTSSDGRAWQRLPDRPKFGFYIGPARDYSEGVIVQLYVDGDELVAEGHPECDCQVTTGPVTWRSADGVEWARQQDIGEVVLGDPAWRPIPGGDGWIRLGRGYRPDGYGAHALIETSVDQSVWRTVYLGLPGTRLNGLQSFNVGWVAVGSYEGGESRAPGGVSPIIPR